MQSESSSTKNTLQNISINIKTQKMKFQPDHRSRISFLIALIDARDEARLRGAGRVLSRQTSGSAARSSRIVDLIKFQKLRIANFRTTNYRFSREAVATIILRGS